MTKTLLALLFVCSLALAQAATPTLNVTVSPATIVPGQTLTATLTLVDTVPSAGLAGIQWNKTVQFLSGVVGPTGIVISSQLAGAAATTAGKAVTCSAAGTLCIEVGINSLLFASGPVAIATIPIPVTTPVGPYSVQITGTQGVNLAGTAVAVAAGPAALFTIGAPIAPSDLNGDGKTDSADLTLQLSQIVGKTACGNADLNHDGKCDLVDAMILIRVALGL